MGWPWDAGTSAEPSPAGLFHVRADPCHVGLCRALHAYFAWVSPRASCLPASLRHLLSLIFLSAILLCMQPRGCPSLCALPPQIPLHLCKATCRLPCFCFPLPVVAAPVARSLYRGEGDLRAEQHKCLALAQPLCSSLGTLGLGPSRAHEQ